MKPCLPTAGGRNDCTLCLDCTHIAYRMDKHAFALFRPMFTSHVKQRSDTKSPQEVAWAVVRAGAPSSPSGDRAPVPSLLSKLLPLI